MISQAFIIKENKVLMVKQYVKRGDIVWNFPGGNIEEGETPEQAAIRETKEETGCNIRLTKLLHVKNDRKYTFLAEIVGGQKDLERVKSVDSDIVDIHWVSIEDSSMWDDHTRPILEIYKSNNCTK